MAKEFKITSLRLADLEKELTYLKTTREREIAAMIAEARSYGDLSENSEYDAAKNEQATLYLPERFAGKAKCGGTVLEAKVENGKAVYEFVSGKYTVEA